MATAMIRPMALPDIDGLTAMILADDWGDRRTWLRFVATHPACRAAVAVDEDGRAFATAVASVNGSVGWVGTVWVAPERRRDGVGMALTRTVIEQAESAGCRTIVLVATDAGRPLYERIGFEVATWYLTMEAAGLPVGPVDPRIRPFRADDLAAMAALDAAATGEDRRHLLEAFATPDSTRLLDDDARPPRPGSWSGRHGAVARRSPRTRMSRWPSSRPGGVPRGPSAGFERASSARTPSGPRDWRRLAGPRRGARRG